MVAYTFNLNILEAEADIREFQASLVYIGSYRTARATETMSQYKQNKKQKFKKNLVIGAGEKA